MPAIKLSIAIQIKTVYACPSRALYISLSLLLARSLIAHLHFRLRCCSCCLALALPLTVQQN